MGRALLLASGSASGLTGSMELETKIKCWRSDRSPGFSVFCAGTCNSRQACCLHSSAICCFLIWVLVPQEKGAFPRQGWARIFRNRRLSCWSRGRKDQRRGD